MERWFVPVSVIGGLGPLVLVLVQNNLRLCVLVGSRDVDIPVVLVPSGELVPV